VHMTCPASHALASASFIPFVSHDTPPTEIYTLSLHDALPISRAARSPGGSPRPGRGWTRCSPRPPPSSSGRSRSRRLPDARSSRSEEHTSELQSPYDLVCRLLLEKKK